MFPTKYPIMMAGMNGGSEIKLAIACQKAGIMSSLYLQGTQEHRLKTFKMFCDVTGTNHVVMVIPEWEVVKNIVAIEELLDAGARYFEIVSFGPVQDLEPFKWSKKTLSQQKEIYRQMFVSNISILNSYHWQLRVNRPVTEDQGLIYGDMVMDVDAGPFVWCLKGNDAAGLSFATTYTTKELFDLQKKISPDISTIPYGGVGTAEDVKYYVDGGAFSVAVGTRLSLSEESPLSKEAKLKIIEKQSQKTRLPDTKQNALILGDADHVINSNKEDPNDWNRADSLLQGQRGDGKSGHVYVGEGIKHSKKIQPVKEIISELTSKL